MPSGLPAPVIAPWAAAWTQYPARLVIPTKVNEHSYTVTIPAGEYWRILFAQMEWGTDATAGNRAPRITFAAPNIAGLVFGTPISLAPSSVVYCTWGIGLSSFSSQTLNEAFNTMALPDVIWPQRTLLTLALDFAAAGDVAFTNGPVAVEVYKEDDAGNLVPEPEPIPSPIPA